MAVIDIVLRDGAISMPVDFPVNDGALTWRVWSEVVKERSEDQWVLERTLVRDATWLVSFRDGTAFFVRKRTALSKGSETTSTGDPLEAAVKTTDLERAGVPVSPDVRNGQEIVLPRDSRRPGRYSYRFSVFVNEQTYGVFDCPSIIIT